MLLPNHIPTSTNFGPFVLTFVHIVYSVQFSTKFESHHVTLN